MTPTGVGGGRAVVPVQGPGDPVPFDLAAPLPTGVTLLEASAGTGKTFAIAALVARYVAEGTPLERLLVITFTRMATGELRERVRERLVTAADALAVILGRRAGRSRPTTWCGCWPKVPADEIEQRAGPPGQGRGRLRRRHHRDDPRVLSPRTGRPRRGRRRRARRHLRGRRTGSARRGHRRSLHPAVLVRPGRHRRSTEEGGGRNRPGRARPTRRPTSSRSPATTRDTPAMRGSLARGSATRSSNANGTPG